MSQQRTVKQPVLRALWRDRIHVEPNALDLSPAEVRASFGGSIWEPGERLLVELERFPRPWLEIWRDSPSGHVVLTHSDSSYHGQRMTWHKDTLPSVCYVSITDLHQRRDVALWALLHLFDHLLGSDAEPDGRWFSAGAGRDEQLREASMRYVRIHELGYAHHELGVTLASDYFARTVWLYLSDPQRLNMLDPLVFKLYKNDLTQTR